MVKLGLQNGPPCKSPLPQPLISANHPVAFREKMLDSDIEWSVLDQSEMLEAR